MTDRTPTPQDFEYLARLCRETDICVYGIMDGKGCPVIENREEASCTDITPEDWEEAHNKAIA